MINVLAGGRIIITDDASSVPLRLRYPAWIVLEKVADRPDMYRYAKLSTTGIKLMLEVMDTPFLARPGEANDEDDCQDHISQSQLTQLVLSVG